MFAYAPFLKMNEGSVKHSAHLSQANRDFLTANERELARIMAELKRARSPSAPHLRFQCLEKSAAGGNAPGGRVPPKCNHGFVKLVIWFESLLISR
jgi:hypothetical protein